jgi:8-oxo-dGTP diphosphatase
LTSEMEFLRKYDASQFERPSVTVDIVVFTIMDGELKTLMVKRGQPPFANHWALPGGFVKMDETLEAAAGRELEEETGVKPDEVYLEQLYTFGEPKRDPRTRVITVAYFALVISLRRLRNKLEYTAVGLELLPPAFTLTELQNLYEAILNERLDKRNFRKKVLSIGILQPTKSYKKGGHRPAMLYRFKRTKSASTFKRIKFERGQ